MNRSTVRIGTVSTNSSPIFLLILGLFAFSFHLTSAQTTDASTLLSPADTNTFIDDLIAKHQTESNTIDLSSSSSQRFPPWTDARMVAGLLRVLKLTDKQKLHRLRFARAEGEGSGSMNETGSEPTIGEPWFKPIPVVTAAFGIFFSILFIGFGYRCYHLTMCFSGFIPVTGFFYLILTLHTAIYPGVALVIGLFVGTAFGILALLFNPFAHAVLGGFAGVLIAAILATTIDTPVFDWIAVLLIPVCLAFFGLCIPKAMVIFATSFLGGYGIMAAIDYFGFGAGGFSMFFPNLLHHFENMNPNWMTWLLVLCTLGITAIGLVAQYRYSAKGYIPQPIVDLKIGQPEEEAYEDLPDAKDRKKSGDVEMGNTPSSSSSSSASQDPVSMRLKSLSQLPHPRPPPAPSIPREPTSTSSSSSSSSSSSTKQRLFDS